MVRRRLLWLPLTMLLLVACNLGQGVPTDVTPTVEQIIPQQVTATPPETAVTPTTPSSDPGLAATMGPVTVTGDFTVGSTVSVLVRRGDAVSSVNCLTVHQESNGTVVLDPPITTGPSLDGTFSEGFSYEPDQAGTYSVSCTGVALTVDGLQEVEAQSSPFSIEAKG